MNINKQMSIAVMLITGFIFAVSFGTLYVQTNIVEGTVCSCTLPIPLLIPTFSSLGVFVGSLVYYLMFARIKETEKKSTQYSEEFHLEGSSDTVKEIFEHLKTLVIETENGFILNPQKYYISIKGLKNVAFIKICKM